MLRRLLPMALLQGLVLGFGLAAPASLPAKPLPLEDVPQPLKPWVEWALHGHEEASCPPLYNGTSHRCAWPTRLTLQLADTGGEFRQQWLILKDGWAPLPGEPRRWPQDLSVDGEPALVVEQDGIPGIHLSAGFHSVTGRFDWRRLPGSLQIRPETGLVHLEVNGQSVLYPEIDRAGRLWLQGRNSAAKGDERIKNTLDVLVHRRVVDDIPLLIITRIELEVSGEHREVLLGRAMMPDYIPMVLASPLPARLESDGRLRVQVRPGRWTIDLTARSPGPVDAIALQQSEGPWATEEVWVFEARNHLRLVAVEGVEPIDPRQTSLPREWQGLPAYRVRSGDVLRFKQKRRGDPEPEPDRLTLERDLWLDFDGRGYTLQDRISGSMTQSWRLDVNAPIELGRVTVDGQPQFITRMPEAGREGVELRRGTLQLTADSRLEGEVSHIPAVGWDHDFQKVSARLHLPPGWRLLAAGGVDRARSTWITRWSLLDLFLVLIVAAVVGKLWGWSWGGVALLTLALTYHEPGAPRQAWLHVLAAVALLRVLPSGRFERAVRLYRNLSLVALAVIALPFSVEQVRVALFPQLEQPGRVLGTAPVQIPAGRRAPAEPKARTGEPGIVPETPAPSFADKLAEQSSLQSSLPRLSRYGSVRQYDPKANIQTGPGLPRWSWREVSLRWNGPVERDQSLSLVLLPPGVILVLRLLAVALLALLALRVAGFGLGRGMRLMPSSWGRAGSIAGAGALAALLCGALAPGAAKADIPSDALLEQLRQRLLEKPQCVPQCAVSPRMRLDVEEDILRLRIEIHTAADVAVALPGQRGQFQPRVVRLEAPGAEPDSEIRWQNAQAPQRVELSGTPAQGLFRDGHGSLWLRLPQGRHRVLLEGPLPARSTVQLALPLKPHKVEARVTGWTLEGLHEDGLADDQLQLTRTRSMNTGRGAALPALEPETLPPFVRVERTLHIGLEWDVETRVVRVSPPGTAVVLEIPLLPGESVTTAGVRVQNGKVLVNMAPQQRELRWRSVLEKTERLQLQAPDSSTWTEVWRLDASPIWHVETAGIPVVHHQDQGRWLPEWRPWPGESVSFRVIRPQGVAGRTLTVDGTSLTVKPGRRATDATLDLTLRSSQGGQHGISLPVGARLQSVAIGGKTQPIRQEGRFVTLPLNPGSQSVRLMWREGRGAAGRFVTPAVDLGTESVNAGIQLDLPRNRWVLFTSGPTAGPAVLFWGVLIIIGLLAIGLGRTRRTPLKTRHWVLLGLGLSQVEVWFALLVVGWLFALGSRKAVPELPKAWQFNLMQLGLAGLTLIALSLLFHAVQQGLLGWPEMQIAGNGSNGYSLRWFQDRSSSVLPTASIVSVPTAAYRALMLAWALWLAFALIGWLRWGWECYSAGGFWKSVKLVRPGAAGKKRRPGSDSDPDKTQKSSE